MADTLIADFYPAIQELLSKASGVSQSRIILADQGQSAPVGVSMYATYKPVPVKAYGFPARTRTLEDATQPTTQPNWKDYDEQLNYHLEIMVSVNIYNKGSVDAAWRCLNADMLGDIPEFLFTNNMGWRYVSDIRDLTEIQRAAYQPRHQFDLHLFIEGTVSANILTVAEYPIVIDSDGHTITIGV